MKSPAEALTLLLVIGTFGLGCIVGYVGSLLARLLRKWLARP